MVFSLVHAVVLIAISFIVFKKEEGVFRKIYWPALLVKVISGIAVGLIYTYYYTVGDTFTYFSQGVALADLARINLTHYTSFLWDSQLPSDVWLSAQSQEPRTLFLGKWISLFCLLTQDNYWIIATYFSLISFWCAWYLVKTISWYDEQLTLPAVIAFCFLPSAFFWTSGIIKESLAVAALFFLSAVFLKLYKREKLSVFIWITTAVSLWCLWNLKYYYMAVFLPVALTALVMKLLVLPRLNTTNVYLKVAIWFFVFMLPLYIASLIHPNFYPERFLNVIVSNYNAYTILSKQENMIYYVNLTTDVFSIIQHAPKAAMSACFRPFVWEAHTVLQWFSAIENLIILLSTLYALRNWRVAVNSSERLLIFSIVIYVVLLSVFLALSTPNLGTLMRYRVGFISFLFMLITAHNPLLNRLHGWLRSS